jgi:K319-like protein
MRFTRSLTPSMALILIAVHAALAAPPGAGDAARPFAPWPRPDAALAGGEPADAAGGSAGAFAITPMNMPGYLTPVVAVDFGTQIMRICNGAGLATTPVSGTWGSDARHVYSKQQPWNSDGTLFSIENRSGGSPSPMILDGLTFLPRFGLCGSYPRYDYRWHPSPLHPHEQINVNSAGTELMWFDVVTCTKTRSWTLPITVDYGIGSGEGNPSNDGRFVCLNNNSAMFVVDMDPQPPYAPYPNKRIGPVYTFPPCSLVVSNPTDCLIGNLSISPSGKYVDVKYSSGNDSTLDAHRIYEVDPATLALKPHLMAGVSLRCGSYVKRPNGWIFPLKHADMGLDPYDNDEDVIVGGRSCPGSSLGHVVMVRLRDGQVTALTDPSNEASVYHVSTRSYQRPGWAYITYYKVSGARFSDEVVAVKMDGSHAAERYAHTHSASSSCYRCQPHAVPSPDGKRVIFASNWAQDCGSGCGSSSDIKDYVVSNAGSGSPPPNTAPVVDAGATEVITLPANAALAASEADDGLPNPPGALSNSWSKLSGPGTVTFQDPGAASTQATFSASGAYLLRFTASDGALSSSDTVGIMVNPQGSTSIVERRIAAGTDDAEEGATGAMYLDSSDLELVQDLSTQQVGVRFTSLAVPRGASISHAWIQFETDEVQSEATNLTIHGQAADDAATFSATTSGISSRPTTSAAVSWSPPAWNMVGEAGSGQRTPELAAILQEIVDRPGWVSGNAVAIVITGSGHRTARAFEGVPTGAALLHIEAGPGSAVGVEPQVFHGSRVAVESVWPNPAAGDVGVAYSLKNVGPASLELVDIAGRPLLHRDLGAPGPGHFRTRLTRSRALPPGIYWVRLTQAGRSATSKVVFVR